MDNTFAYTVGLPTFKSSSTALVGLLAASAVLSTLAFVSIIVLMRRVRVAYAAAASGVVPVYSGLTARRIHPWTPVWLHLFASLFGAIGWIQYIINAINWTNNNYDALLQPDRSYSTGWFIMLGAIIVYVIGNICLRMAARRIVAAKIDAMGAARHAAAAGAMSAAAAGYGAPVAIPVAYVGTPTGAMPPGSYPAGTYPGYAPTYTTGGYAVMPVGGNGAPQPSAPSYVGADAYRKV